MVRRGPWGVWMETLGTRPSAHTDWKGKVQGALEGHQGPDLRLGGWGSVWGKFCIHEYLPHGINTTMQMTLGHRL